MVDITQQIADLERLRDAQPPGSPVRASLDDAIAGLRAALPPRPVPSGGVNMGSADIEQMGDAVGGDKLAGDKVLRDKVVHQYFGGQRVEDGERLLRDYLVALLDDNRMLRLSRMTERRQSGADQELLPPLRLQDVFTSLTTDGLQVVVQRRERTAARLLYGSATFQLQ